MTNPINPNTNISVVALTVSNFAQSLPFYQEQIGLTLRHQDGQVAHLGTTTDDLLILHEDQQATPQRAKTGLYHFALLVPSRLELAKTLAHLVQTETPLQGLSDHHVSEAIYLADPDGNGIEIYRDRPRAQWPLENGKPQMGTVAMDVDGVMNELAHQPQKWTGLDAATRMGHIHLHVSNLDQAEEFYNHLLGFDLIMRYGPSASFLSAGGYHHHIGINTWSRVGHETMPATATGLRYYTIQLPSQTALHQIVDNLKRANISCHEQADGIFLRDPSQNGILLATY